jgi:hypothetical protein
MSDEKHTEEVKDTKAFINHAVIMVNKGGKSELQLPTFKNSTELSRIVIGLEAEYDTVNIVKIVRGREMKFRETRQISLF